MNKILLFLLCFSTAVFGQIDGPILKKEVDSLKKNNPELWYADLKPNDERLSVEDSLRKIKLDSLKQTQIDSTKALPEREEIEKPLEIHESVGVALKYLMYGILLMAILYLIFKGNFSFKFKPKNEVIEEIITEDTEIEKIEQLRNVGFQNQIKTAEDAGNFRLAIRLWYLWIIKKASDKALIKFHIKKTNSDYCKEMAASSSPSSSDLFKKCTDYYNRVWFGEVQLTETQYLSIKESFFNLIQAL
jgi:hypothetical protein